MREAPYPVMGCGASGGEIRSGGERLGKEPFGKHATNIGKSEAFGIKGGLRRAVQGLPDGTILL